MDVTHFLGLFWKKTTIDDELPEGAIVGGKDTNGNTIYVGKTKYNGEELPVKVIPESHYAAVAYKEEEVYVEKYRVSSSFPFFSICSIIISSILGFMWT